MPSVEDFMAGFGGSKRKVRQMMITGAQFKVAIKGMAGL